MYINKKLIKLYKNKNKLFLYTKSKSSIITKDLFGKCVYVYNGRFWLKKKIDNSYFLNKSIGSLKNVYTRKWCVYKQKKKKEKKKKKKKIMISNTITLRKYFLWNSQWFCESHYYNLLFEDIKINNYLKSIFSFLKFPSSNYIIKRYVYKLIIQTNIYIQFFFNQFFNSNKLLFFIQRHKKLLINHFIFKKSVYFTFKYISFLLFFYLYKNNIKHQLNKLFIINISKNTFRNLTFFKKKNKLFLKKHYHTWIKKKKIKPKKENKEEEDLNIHHYTRSNILDLYRPKSNKKDKKKSFFVNTFNKIKSIFSNNKFFYTTKFNNSNKINKNLKDNKLILNKKYLIYLYNNKLIKKKVFINKSIILLQNSNFINHNKSFLYSDRDYLKNLSNKQLLNYRFFFFKNKNSIKKKKYINFKLSNFLIKKNKYFHFKDFFFKKYKKWY